MAKSLMLAAAMLLIGTWAVSAGPLHDAVKDGDLARLQELIDANEEERGRSAPRESLGPSASI